ncbi:hypothetical protein VTH06DRAFT_2795 [Thermothelomyces fergusii]
MDSPAQRRRAAVHRFPLRYLLVVPVLLAVLTGGALLLHGDTNIYMLYSQCHARSRLPWLSRLPVLGGPACFLVSFFREAVASVRAAGLMAVVLSFVAGLLTVTTVEAARICNAPSRLIASPTASWLVFDLVAGAFVWQLVIIPAFFRRARDIITARKRQGGGGSGPHPLSGPTDPTFGEAMRHLASPAEAVAVPVAVALGYVLPAALMLLLARPAAVLAWLFFPVWVSLARRAALALTARRAWRGRGNSLHLESSRAALLAVYALPVVCSVLSNALFVWTRTRPDDREEMTRSALKFIIINVFFLGLTVLYWILIEAGWPAVLVTVVASVVLGPGAGVCLGWVYREKTVDLDRGVTVVAVGSRRQSEGAEPSEETPLLR